MFDSLLGNVCVSVDCALAFCNAFMLVYLCTESIDDIEQPGRIMMERPRRRSCEFVRQHEDPRWVTQSIAIAKRPPRLLLPTDSLDPDSGDCGSTPSTPGGPNTPGSSFVGSPFSSKLLYTVPFISL